MRIDLLLVNMVQITDERSTQMLIEGDILAIVIVLYMFLTVPVAVIVCATMHRHYMEPVIFAVLPISLGFFISRLMNPEDPDPGLYPFLFSAVLIWIWAIACVVNTISKGRRREQQKNDGQ